jgi:flavin-dependent dehydrogenase
MFDVCVIGAGPAGSMLALRLAQLGHTVALVEKVRFPRPHVGESLTAGVLPLLEVVGLRREFEQAGFVAAPWATVRWAGEIRKRETHGGYQVDRGRFDALLLEAARRAGAAVHQPARLLDWRFDREQWQLRLDSGDCVQARYLADAAGRNSRMLGGSKTPLGPPMLATFAYWRNADPGNGETLVEAGPSRWYWGAPLPDSTFVACVFTTPGRTAYQALIGQSELLSPRFAGAALCGEIRSCDATPYVDTTPVTDRWIKVGDAALTLDPLSSQGTQMALGTALHAAAVIHTMFDRPADTALALDFYQRRVADSAEFHAQVARAFYREQEEPDSAPPPLSPRERVRLSPGLSFVRIPTVAGAYVIGIEGIEIGGRRTAYLGPMNVAEMLRLMNGAPIVAADLVERWSHLAGPAGALQFLQSAWHWRWIEAAADLR